MTIVDLKELEDNDEQKKILVCSFIYFNLTVLTIGILYVLIFDRNMSYGGMARRLMLNEQHIN